ncbi:MAG: hypothetical protein KGJ77_12645, partial [Acidobacteriota bacterium]|nr:hypothetical protein [Acidobacteriota bacterium]
MKRNWLAGAVFCLAALLNSNAMAQTAPAAAPTAASAPAPAAAPVTATPAAPATPAPAGSAAAPPAQGGGDWMNYNPYSGEETDLKNP